MHAHPTCRIWSHEEVVRSGQCIEVSAHQLAHDIYTWCTINFFPYTNIGSPWCSTEEWTGKCWDDGHHGWASQVRAKEDHREVIWRTCRWKCDSLQRGLPALHPFGGDQLTCARARSCQRARMNADCASDALAGLVPCCEDWHAKVTFLSVSLIYEFMYTLSMPAIIRMSYMLASLYVSKMTLFSILWICRLFGSDCTKPYHFRMLAHCTTCATQSDGWMSLDLPRTTSTNVRISFSLLSGHTSLQLPWKCWAWTRLATQQRTTSSQTLVTCPQSRGMDYLWLRHLM